MAAGDRTKRMVFRLRERRRDLDKKLEPTDKEYMNKLTEWQRRICIEHLACRVQKTMSLIPEETDYDLDQNILQITRMQVRVSDTECFNVVGNISEVTGEDLRKLTFEQADADDFITGQVLLLDCYIKPLNAGDAGSGTLGDDLSSIKDPILERDWDDILIAGVLSDYRDMDERKDFPKAEDVEKRINKLRNRKAGLQSFDSNSEAMPKGIWL